MSTPTVDTTAAAKDAWALFWRIFSADKPRRMATLNELGLAPMQSMALMQLRPGEPMTMSAMAHALQCDNSNVTGIADRLEAMGLIERRAAEHDRRVKTLVITELGTRVRGQVELRMSVPPPPLASLSDEDATALRDILQRALDERERALARSDVLRRRADQPRLALLLEDKGRPAGGPSAGEQAREQWARDVGVVEHERWPELDVGGKDPVGLARLELGQRSLLERFGDLVALRADLLRG